MGKPKKTSKITTKKKIPGKTRYVAKRVDAAMAANEDIDLKLNKRATRSNSKSGLVKIVNPEQLENKVKTSADDTKRKSRGKTLDVADRNRHSRSRSRERGTVEFKEGDNVISMKVGRGESREFPENDENINEDSEMESVESSDSPASSDEEVEFSSKSHSSSRSLMNDRSPSRSVESGEAESDSAHSSESGRQSPSPKKRKKVHSSHKLKSKVKRMQNYMVKKGLVDTSLNDAELERLMEEESEDEARYRASKSHRSRKRGKKSAPCHFDEHPDACRSPSEITVYKRAVPSISDKVKKRLDVNETPRQLSDKFRDLKFYDSIPNAHEIDLFLDRSRGATKRRKRSVRRSRSRSRSYSARRERERTRDRSRSRSRRRERNRYSEDQRHDHSRSISRLRDEDRDFGLEAEQHAEDLIREAEKAKAKMYEVPGKKTCFMSKDQAFIHSALVDQNYLTVAAHVNKAIKAKIQNFEYIDFAKLLPRDKIAEEEDDRLTWVNKGGYPVMVPAVDRELAGGITSIGKWDQAFRVFSDILTTKYPSKINELLQYSHVIATAAQTYTWENVYGYDKAFRIHISEYPERSWGVILQQAWNMRLNDRIRRDGTGPSSSGGQRATRKEPCRRFQRGNCSYGINCIYDHRCNICNKWGHGAHICRRRSGYNEGENRRSSGGQGYSSGNNQNKGGSGDKPPPAYSRDYKPSNNNNKKEPGPSASKTLSK